MRVIFDREAAENPGLFAGHAWMDAAEAWALEQGLRVERWQVDQRFRAAGQWHTVAWRDGTVGQLGEWAVSEDLAESHG